jgi:hypothetical protein
MTIRLTPEEDARIKGTAWYMGITIAQLLRDGAEKLRQALVDEGKRPPLRPPGTEPDGEFQGRKTPRR